MSKKLAINERVGAYGYGLYQSEIDEYLASDEEWEAIKASDHLFTKITTALFFHRRPLKIIQIN
jgi:hypothetical protein